MDTNEIITNEEVTEVVEKATETAMPKLSNASLSMVFCAGGLVGAIGVLAIQHFAIPAVKKFRAKKKKPDVVEVKDSTMTDTEEDDSEEDQ